MEHNNVYGHALVYSVINAVPASRVNSFALWPPGGAIRIDPAWSGRETPNPLRLYPDVHPPVGPVITLIAGTWPSLLTLDAYSLTRAAFVKMLVKARSLPLVTGESGPFIDTGTHWSVAQGYLGAALQAGFVRPEEYGGQFQPDSAISRRRSLSCWFGRWTT